MKLSQLSHQVIEQIKSCRRDEIGEKHEGLESWAYNFDFADKIEDKPELMNINGNYVLLPIRKEEHPNIKIFRSISSADGKTITLFFQNTTYSDDLFESGYLAICDQFPGEDFFLAIVYHEWFIFENPYEEGQIIK